MHLRFPIEEVCIHEDATVKDAIVAIDRHGLGVVLVVDNSGALVGMATDGDVRRALIRGSDILGPVAAIMNRAPTTAAVGTPAPELLRRITVRIRHLPLLDEAGKPRDVFLYEHRHHLPVAEPLLGDEELRNVTECILSGWISSGGPFVERFEEEFAAFAGTPHAVSTTSGTTALHLLMVALDIGPGDEVVVPALSFVASASTVVHAGATPVFADVDRATWTLDPAAFESAVTPKTKAVVPVHLYGHPADMDAIRAIAERRGIVVIEDAAEAHGARYRGVRVGSLGRAAAFSFFGNKILTTGEGGMITTADGGLAERLRVLRGHGMNPQRRYWHDVVGYNYRLTALQAAVGVAQLGKIDSILEKKRENALRYRMHLDLVPGLELPAEAEWAESVWWMYSVLLGEDFPVGREEAAAALAKHGVDTRPVFPPIHLMPPYGGCTGQFPVAEDIAARGITLPSGVGLAREELDRVASRLRELAAL